MVNSRYTNRQEKMITWSLWLKVVIQEDKKDGKSYANQVKQVDTSYTIREERWSPMLTRLNRSLWLTADTELDKKDGKSYANQV